MGVSPWGIASLRCDARPDLEFVRPGCALGKLLVRCRAGGQGWSELRSVAAATTWHDGTARVGLTQSFKQTKGRIVWTLTVKNEGTSDVEIGDLALSLPMFDDYTRKAEETFERRVVRHAFIGGEGSWVYWQPAGGGGPYLLMSALEGTSLEFFTNDRTDYASGGGEYWAYMHSAAYADTEKRGTWRQERTSLVLKASSQESYSFAFTWAESVDGLRQAIRREGGLDVKAAPGMVVPQGTALRLALGSVRSIASVEPEHPDRTTVRRLRSRAGYSMYSVKFARLGENLLTVLRGSRRTVLEFIVTQPVETLIKKRAAFIVANQQHKAPSKWYDGLFSLWDARQPPGRNLLGPDNLGGQLPYAVSGSDDPCNGKGLLLAEKNVAYPDPREIGAIEYYLRHFVWGKLQRTDKETPHPYGVYGCDSWLECRTSSVGLNSGGHGRERMWRTFDYTTLFALYYDMYLIAKAYPSACTYLDAAGYLERAYGTARAYFEVPYSIDMRGWDFTGYCNWAYTLGNFHEKYLIKIVAALEREGKAEKAAYLRGEWEKKVRFFLCGDKYPWTSEMPVDSTAFESTYAIADYALKHELPAADKLWTDKTTGKTYSYPRITRTMKTRLMERQLQANLACRGWLEPAYYQLGSDFRACGSAAYCLSYMSQMGGWAIMDYGLRFATNPAEWVRLGYASMLSSWALVNAGDEASGYGYWYPGKVNDGMAGWGFLPRQVGTEWNSATREIGRGPWPVDGEIDHGFTAGVEGAATIVIDDPLFGLTCYGGQVEKRGNRLRIVPEDGVRRRLYVVTGHRRVCVSLDFDGFVKGRPVVFAGDKLSFRLERRSPCAHQVRVQIEGIRRPVLSVDGKRVRVEAGVAVLSIAGSKRRPESSSGSRRHIAGRNDAS